MRQVIVLQIGQGGIQVGNSCWQLFCLQHNIIPNGQIINQPIQQNHSQTYFYQSSKGKYVPRSLFIDLQPTVIDQIKSSNYKRLFHPQNFIAGKEDAANNFAKGIHTIGKNLIDKIQDRIRKQTEKCNSFQGFLLFSALGGGTGSGLGSLMLRGLSQDYRKKTKIGFNIFPSPSISTSCVQPYNAVLATRDLIDQQDVSVVLDNQSLYNICSKKLDIDQPNYKNINRLIAQMVSSLTYSSRFNGPLNVSLDDFQTNLVPYPRIHFMLSSYSPFINSQRQYLAKMNPNQLTQLLFESQNMMVKCNIHKGKYIACCLNYRGNVIPYEVHSNLHKIKEKKTINFVDWCPTNFKVSINHDLPTVVQGGQIAKTISSASMICNSTSISQVFAKIIYKFDLLYDKRAFFHWYSMEGLSGGQFRESREQLAVMEKDYGEVNIETE